MITKSHNYNKTKEVTKNKNNNQKKKNDYNKIENTALKRISSVWTRDPFYYVKFLLFQQFNTYLCVSIKI